MNNLPLDFDRQSFSRRGAWLKLNFSTETPHRLKIRTLRQQATNFKEHNGWAHDCYELALFRDGEEIAYETVAFASHLNLSFPDGQATVLFTDHETLAVYAQGVSIHWIPLQDFSWHYAPDAAQSEWLASPNLAKTAHHFRVTHGSLSLNADPEAVTGSLGKARRSIAAIANQPDATGQAACAFRETLTQVTQSPTLPPLTEALAAARAEIADWQSSRPAVPAELETSVRIAWQQMGSFQASPSGTLTRQTLFCSNNSWLTRIWTWDNCFHGIGLAHRSAELAFDQLFAALDHQAPNGALPDSVSDLKPHYGFAKPPVYGWTIRELIHVLGLEACRPFFAELLPRLERLTDYWLTCHRHPQDDSGLCFYRHGNDSGWDNATVFSRPGLVRSPDLDAYLVLQMEVTAQLAEELGHSEKSTTWNQRASEHLEKLLSNMVVEDRFISRRVPTGEVVENGHTCGLHLIPILLAHRLPKAVLKTLLHDLRPDGPFFTSCGIASEATDSPHYKSDGYWRGPAWAPVQMQIYAGLRDLGESELARELLTRTTRMWAKYPTFSEHHDALTGEPRQAPGVQWTAAAHVHFAALLAKA